MVSVKVKFRPSSIEGKMGTLYFQVIQHRITRIQKTRYKLYPEEWDTRSLSIILPTENPERHQLLSGIQKSIRQDLARFDECLSILAHNKIDYSADDIVETFRKRCLSGTLNAFAHKLISQMEEQGRFRTGETYKSALESFMRFRSGQEILLEEINQDIIKAYETYLKQQHLTLNTISFYMRILRAIYNRAAEKELTRQRNPFRHVYTGIEKTVKRAIPIQIVRLIKEKKLNPADSISYARDMFLFSFYTRGMSFVDMAYLKKKDLSNGILTYRRKKTGQQLSIKWEQCMQEIIDKYPPNPTEYLLPIIISEKADKRRQYKNSMTLINRKLKNLSAMTHSPYPLSMYVARHSWASIAKSKNIPLSIISECMGHDSESTTQIYLASLDNAVIDMANHLVINDL